MADSRSGASQLLTIGGTQLTREDGVTGFRLNYDTAKFTTTSGGITSVQNEGRVAVGGSYNVLETERTMPLLLGKNGARINHTWNDGLANRMDSAECICLVSRVFEDRGPSTAPTPSACSTTPRPVPALTMPAATSPPSPR